MLANAPRLGCCGSAPAWGLIARRRDEHRRWGGKRRAGVLFFFGVQEPRWHSSSVCRSTNVDYCYFWPTTTTSSRHVRGFCGEWRLANDGWWLAAERAWRAWCWVSRGDGVLLCRGERELFVPRRWLLPLPSLSCHSLCSRLVCPTPVLAVHASLLAPEEIPIEIGPTRQLGVAVG